MDKARQPAVVLLILILGLLAILPAIPVQAAVIPHADYAGYESLRFPDAVAAVVAARAGSSLWIDAEGWTARGESLLAVLSAAAEHGLDPLDYHYTMLSAYRPAPASWVLNRKLRAGNGDRLERLMTDAYLGYGVDVAGGRLEQAGLPLKWLKPELRTNLLSGLQEQLIRGVENDDSTLGPLGLDAFVPDRPEYTSLQDALKCERARQESGWNLIIAEGDLLRPGAGDSRVPQLRRRLVASGDHSPLALVLPRAADWISIYTYDRPLVVALKRFQARHGLVADGVVGPETRAALNVPADDRIAQILVNLERLRWLPADLGETHIRVNIPDFRLVVRRETTTVFATKAVVGRQERPTPVLSGAISSLVMNPYWNVPQKLARKDLLPKVKRDTTYLSERDIKVYVSWTPGAAELDPAALDWAAIKPWNMAYKFRQSPGPENPLGQVKFMFANPYSVFIHDTNHKGRFNSQRRPFSSGCIRIEDPLELARLLYADQNAESETDQLAALVESQENRWLSLRKPVPVHLMYQTCWVDEKGVVQYRDDVYGYDALLAAALASHTALPVEPAVTIATAAPPVSPVSPSREPSVVADHQVRTGPVSTWTNPGPR